MSANPSMLLAMSGGIILRLNALCGLHNHHIEGGLVKAPSTASTQATGASGALALRVNTDASLSTIRGTKREKTLAADVVLQNAAFAWGATSAKEVYCSVIYDAGAANDGDTISGKFGTVAATGVAVPLTDAEIDTLLGHANWIRMADLLVSRTADTTITVAYDNKVRPQLAHFNDLAETEAAFRS